MTAERRRFVNFRQAGVCPLSVHADDAAADVEAADVAAAATAAAAAAAAACSVQLHFCPPPTAQPIKHSSYPPPAEAALL